MPKGWLSTKGQDLNLNDRMTDGSDGNNPEACIIHLTAENKDRWNKLMAAAVLATGHRLYAFLDGIRIFSSLICILLGAGLYT